MEKRRYPIKHIREFLEHFESNMFNQKKRTEEKLFSTFHNRLKGLTSFCLEGKYIKETTETVEGKEVNVYTLKPEGLNYLESIRNLNRDKQRDNLQRVLVFATIVLSFSAIVSICAFFNLNKILSFSILIILFIIIIINKKKLFNKG